MNTPGFTAEASLYKTTAEYHSRTAHKGRWTDNKGSIVPQARWGICDSLLTLLRNGLQDMLRFIYLELLIYFPCEAAGWSGRGGARSGRFGQPSARVGRAEGGGCSQGSCTGGSPRLHR
jgi:hypothetical protein